MAKTKTSKMATGKKTELSLWMQETAQDIGFVGIHWVDDGGNEKIKT